MANFMTVCRKELGDQLGSKRYILLFALIVVLSVLSAYQGAAFIRDNPNANFLAIFTGSQSGFSFVTLMVYFGPIIGLSLGFDAINKERSTGSLSVLLSQPIFRDSILNGKFLAGVAALALLAGSTVGIMVGIAIPLLGFGPALADVSRIAVFALFTILYLAFWLALSLLFSTVIKKTTSSVLAAISTWLVFAFIIAIIASLVAGAAAPVSSPTGFATVTIQGNRTDMFGGNVSFAGDNGFQFTPPNQTETSDFIQQQQTHDSIESAIQSISPTYLYNQAASTILGTRTGSSSIGLIDVGSGTPFRSLGTTQSIASCWPQVTAIAVCTVACFVAAYMLFLRREIRAGG
ncbi:MAG: ABC transporter permease [Candidatus Bathyarchaeota archaeon]|nr:ABC transporter permease [Candidatus Bathyarchaeota archaeon]